MNTFPDVGPDGVSGLLGGLFPAEIVTARTDDQPLSAPWSSYTLRKKKSTFFSISLSADSFSTYIIHCWYKNLFLPSGGIEYEYFSLF